MPDRITHEDLKWLAEFVDSDNGEIGINDNGEPYIKLHSTNYGDVKRVDEIFRKFGIEGGEITFDPPDD